MHTLVARDTVFRITIDGRPGNVSDLMPRLGDDDRLGVVVRSPLGGVGASAVVFAMVVDFYRTHDDALRALGPGELLYPEHYLFHVGAARGDYSWLDFWPAHKEVVVDHSPAAVASSLLDHRITRLLIEDVAPHPPLERLPSGLHDALSHQIASSLAFSADGRTAGADVTVAIDPTFERWVEWTIDPDRAADRSNPVPSPRTLERMRRAAEVTDDERRVARLAREELQQDGRPVETYRRVTVPDALALLAAAATPGR